MNMNVRLKDLRSPSNKIAKGKAGSLLVHVMSKQAGGGENVVNACDFVNWKAVEADQFHN